MATIDQQLGQIIIQAQTWIQQNPIPAGIVGILVFFALAYYKKGRFWESAPEEQEYEPTDWETKIPSEMKKIAMEGGKQSDKELWLGNERKVGLVYGYYTETMPTDVDYMEYLFGDFDKSDYDEDDMKDVYILVSRDSGSFSKWTWKITDDAMGKTRNTKFHVVSEDNVEEERDRFKVDHTNIDFKMEYGKIFVEKGMTTEATTDQFPLYQARKNIVEGIEEFSMKTLFLDRKHSSQVAQMREDVDEEALKRLLGQGKDF